MLKKTLYGALAGGFIAAAVSVSPVAAAPATAIAPQVDTNTSEVQHRHWRRHHRHYRHHHRHNRHYSRHHYRQHYYAPRPSVFRPW